MFATNSGGPVLFAADATVAFDVGEFLPMIIGLAFAVGVLVVGLFMFRNKPVSKDAEPPTAAEPPVDAAVQGEVGQPQAAAGVIRCRSPLWGMALPGVVVLLLGGVLFGVIVPFARDLISTRDNLESKIRPVNPNSWKWSNPITPTPMPPMQMQQFQQPQIQVPPFQPPMPLPKIPQVSIDRKGFIRTR